jgi:hypothetical protein
MYYIRYRGFPKKLEILGYGDSRGIPVILTLVAVCTEKGGRNAAGPCHQLHIAH